MASRVGDGVTIFSSASKSSYTTGTDGGANYTVGSGADRVLQIWVHGYTDTSGGAKGASSVTHNGQAATKYPDAAFLNRTWLELWYIINPTAGAGGTTVATNSLNRAMRVEVLEATGVDQTTPFGATSDSFGAGSTTTRTLSLTTSAANALLVMGVSVQSGAGTFSASDGGTLTDSGGGQTGTGGFTDVSGAVAYEAVPTAGAQTLTISWANANDAVGLMVEVLNAAGGGAQTITGAAYSDSDTFGAGTVGASYAITGAVLSDADSFGAGTLSTAYTITGAAFSDGDTFGAGVIVSGLVIGGALFADPDAFGAGTITATRTITGAVYADPDVFGSGTISAAGGISGGHYSDPDAFGAGAIAATYGIGGAAFADADTFGAGTLSTAYTITGVGYSDSDSFGAGVMLLGGAAQITNIILAMRGRPGCSAIGGRGIAEAVSGTGSVRAIGGGG